MPAVLHLVLAFVVVFVPVVERYLVSMFVAMLMLFPMIVLVMSIVLSPMFVSVMMISVVMLFVLMLMILPVFVPVFVLVLHFLLLVFVFVMMWMNVLRIHWVPVVIWRGHFRFVRSVDATNGWSSSRQQRPNHIGIGRWIKSGCRSINCDRHSHRYGHQCCAQQQRSETSHHFESKFIITQIS